MNYRILGIITAIAVMAVVAFYYQPPADMQAEIDVAVAHNTILDTASSVTVGDIPESVTRANNAFAIDFYKEVAVEGKSIFFSPLGAFTAFSLLYEGAQHETAEQLESVFRIERDDILRASDVVKVVMATSKDFDSSIYMASAIWPADWFNPYDSYISVAQDVYNAKMESVSYTNEQGILRINEWASDNTNGRIDKVLDSDDVDDDTVMVLSSVVHFEGIWESEFSREATEEAAFWDGTAEITVDFMKTQDTFEYMSDYSVQVIKLPYDGDELSMLIILPHGRDGIADLEERISTGAIERWRSELRPEVVSVTMPKISIKNEYDLIPPLRTLGVTNVFDRSSSDLAGMGHTGSERLYVSKATHNTYLDVNEAGTEAGATTTIVTTIKSAIAEPTQRFVADHPFMILIQDDNSGMIFFMGRITDPTS